MMLFAALHESAAGPKLPIRDVRSWVANGGRPEVVGRESKRCF
jgi:hypothetical protein